MASKKGTMPSTELVVAGQDSNFLALRMSRDEVSDLVKANLGGATVDASLLDRVKMPSGGTTVWEVPTMDGEEHVKVLEGVIIRWGTVRVYWKDKYGEGEAGAPPNCTSQNGVVGVVGEEPGESLGGECAACPLNEFGSGHNGRSKACTEMRQIFLLPEDSIIPIVINATPGSLRPLSQYFMRLLRAGVKSTAVVSKLALEKDTNKDGQGFSKILPSSGSRLDPEAAARIEALAYELEPLFNREVTNITQADAEGTAVDA